MEKTMTKETVRFLDKNPKGAGFAYRPPNSGPPIAQNATLGVKFSQGIRILDPWWIVGGTRWSRSLFRMKHPIVYSKRGVRNLYRRIKRFFFGDPPMIMCRKWITKEEALKQFPNKEKDG
jgi:hypothetical protein